jgi:Ala-tRNA(Pro) deacylase
MPAMTREDLLALLARLGIAHVTHDHPPIFTVAEGEAWKARMPGGHSKNLFLEDRAGNLVLVSALATTTIRINALHKVIGRERMSFGSPERMLDVLGVTPGSVTAFALANDSARGVQFVLDAALLDHDPVNFHPLTNTATTAVSPDGLMRFLAHCGITPRIIRFAEDGLPQS